jgi:tRNA-guanine transglycosylase
MFEIIKKDTTTKARVGILKNAYGGVAETPSYVIVGTRAEVRTLTPEDFPAIKVQMLIANTYHLWRMLEDSLETFEGLHARMHTDAILMTDSGGFQVFSLGFAREHGVSKVGVSSVHREKPNILRDVFLQIKSFLGISHKRNLVRITPWGTYFKDEGYGDTTPVFLGPKKSIRIQEKLGADIILAFDECTSPKHGYWYTKWAMHRTHTWARQCIAAKKSTQALYGIVQGGNFEDLRKESARVIGGMPFDGFAIGGSFGEEEMRNVLEWCIPYLPEEKPRHLLGIGRIEDILDGVARGIDTFDCVIPTREARHGSLWTHHGRYNITGAKYEGSTLPLEEGCTCPACSRGVTQGILHDEFRAKNMNAGREATLHNIHFFNTFMAEIRAAIKADRFQEFRKEIEEQLKTHGV